MKIAKPRIRLFCRILLISSQFFIKTLIQKLMIGGKLIRYLNSCRSSRSQIFLKIGVEKKFRRFHRKTPVLESLFNKVAGLQACNFITNRLQHRCFPVKFTKFLRTLFLTEHLWWLFLYLSHRMQRKLKVSMEIHSSFCLNFSDKKNNTIPVVACQ